MSLRFKRSYSLTFSVLNRDDSIEEVFTISNLRRNSDGELERIERPIAIVFDIEKSVEGGRSTMNLEIKNLSQSLRSKLDKRREQDNYIKVSLSIGYGTSIREVYFGTASKIESASDGVDFITSVESLDGQQALETSYTAITLDAGVNLNREIAESAEGVGIGLITSQKTLTRPKVFIGNTIDLLEKNKEADGLFFIDAEKIYILKEGEAVEGFVPTVSAQTGLISTPTVDGGRVTIRTQINAAVRLGGRIRLESKSNPSLNGVYFVRRMSIAGDMYGQEWTQDIVATAR